MNNFQKAYLESLILKNLFADKTKENFKVYYADSHVNSGIYGAVIFAKQKLRQLEIEKRYFYYESTIVLTKTKYVKKIWHW